MKIGQKAPNFKLEGVIKEEFKTLSLSDFKGKWVVLFFYPLDFTFVCPTEITSFSDRIKEFKELGTEVLGVSVDSKFSHLAWLNTPRNKGGLGTIEYPLLSDINKAACMEYGVLIEEAGIALRGLFIIDDEGVLQYKVVHNLGIGRSVDETLRVIQALQTVKKTGEVCPANWKPGDSTMKPDPKGSQAYFNKLK